MAAGVTIRILTLCFQMVFFTSLWINTECDSSTIECPNDCDCLGPMVDCSQKGLIGIPKDLPNWVEILEMSANAINELNTQCFHGLTKLEELDLSSNQLPKINGSIFQDIPGLVKLKISHNQLVEIPTLGRLVNLTELRLSHNKIEEIRHDRLQGLPGLKTLELNFNKITRLNSSSFPENIGLNNLLLNNNRVTSLETGVFNNLVMLRSLKLNKNRIESLHKDLLAKLRNLIVLDLSRNRLKLIEGLSFENLGQLTSLKLRKNHISVLMDGAFFGLGALQNLELDCNNLTTVNNGWLYGLTSLQTLNLSHNTISSILTGAWESTQQLWKLDLSHNDLTGLDEETFMYLGSLKYLNLDHNRIAYIAPKAFASLSTLDHLEMNNNQIAWTVEDMQGAFEGLTSLTQLTLNSNHIKSLTRRAFEGLTQLRQLHLMDNEISTIQSTTFNTFIGLKDLRMNSSSLLCDCNLSWLPEWVERQSFKEHLHLECAHPIHLANRNILRVPKDQFICDDKDVPKPFMITHPEESVSALKGSNVTLSCTASSSSNASLVAVWKKNNKQLRSPLIENYANVIEDNIILYTSKLRLLRVTADSVGAYQCIISNHLGSAYSRRSRIKVHVFPSFTKTPSDVTVRVGKPARLECSAGGSPAPIIAWQKDGGDDFPAARERRMLVMPSDDVFVITNVKSTDQGIYSCTATNEAGTNIVNATVNVLEMPSFVHPMHDKEVLEGDTIALECLALGSPKPKLNWLKDGEPLVLGPNYVEAQGYLIISQAQFSDSGAYTCEISNALGTERGISVVNVRHNSDETSTTTGIVIIAVVCCVVGTSLVWVIIIYQTRKRGNEFTSTPSDEAILPGDLEGRPFKTTTLEKGLVHPPLSPTYGHHNSYHGLQHLTTANSDSDTLQSASPSTQSTRSSHSTTLLHTFHPHVAPSDIVEEKALIKNLGPNLPTKTYRVPAHYYDTIVDVHGTPSHQGHYLEELSFPERRASEHNHSTFLQQSSPTISKPAAMEPSPISHHNHVPVDSSLTSSCSPPATSTLHQVSSLTAFPSSFLPQDLYASFNQQLPSALETPSLSSPLPHADKDEHMTAAISPQTFAEMGGRAEHRVLNQYLSDTELGSELSLSHTEAPLDIVDLTHSAGEAEEGHCFIPNAKGPSLLQSDKVEGSQTLVKEVLIHTPTASPV